jgi:hypothetical protein
LGLIEPDPFAGFLPGELRFDAVQLIDDLNEGQTDGATVGADIDAVGDISSIFESAIFKDGFEQDPLKENHSQ